MNTSILAAIEKLYNKLNVEEPDIINDIRCVHLTENTARSGFPVLWYSDETNNIAINIDTLELMTAEEMERELY